MSYSQQIKQIATEQTRLCLILQDVSQRLEELLKLSPTDLKYMQYHNIEMELEGGGWISADEIENIAGEGNIFLTYQNGKIDGELYETPANWLEVYTPDLYEEVYNEIVQKGVKLRK